MKGIILAGGEGTRLYPLTQVTSKQLLPIYDKPMIYYPLSTLMLAGIREILIISTEKDIVHFKALLGNGEEFGIHLSYAIQLKPEGLAQAFLIGEEFIGDDTCALILGDNIFYGNNFTSLLLEAVMDAERGFATIFGYYVQDPQRYGVVDFDKNGEVLSIIEKPQHPKTNYAVTGIYFYDKNAVKYAKSLVPSERNELEITDLNNIYLKQNNLRLKLFGRGFAWMDTGTIESLYDATEFVRTIENRQGVIISAPEEIAYRYNWITQEALEASAKKYSKSSYGVHLKAVAEGRYFSTVSNKGEL